MLLLVVALHHLLVAEESMSLALVDLDHSMGAFILRVPLHLGLKVPLLKHQFQQLVLSGGPPLLRLPRSCSRSYPASA